MNAKNAWLAVVLAGLVVVLGLGGAGCLNLDPYPIVDTGPECDDDAACADDAAPDGAADEAGDQ